MTTGPFVYPNLQGPDARILLDDRKHRTLEELRNLGDLSHPQAPCAETGGRPAAETEIKKVQEKIRGVADACGFPARPSGWRQKFDLECSRALMETMDIVPGDAANEGVWSFLTLVVVPEIGPWRFAKPPDERLLGKPRNTLRRLWWRAWSLGPDLYSPPEGCKPLGEDTLVQIEERGRLSGSQHVARAIMHGIWRAEVRYEQVGKNKGDFARKLVVRLRARSSHLSLVSLSGGDLDELIDALSAESVEAVQRA